MENKVKIVKFNFTKLYDILNKCIFSSYKAYIIMVIHSFHIFEHLTKLIFVISTTFFDFGK
jgi:hypothetical protein